jgi:tRNA C32,U32 (ribose-2'-O)-methylase TrmJ
VRSSVGCLFTNQIASGTTAEISFSKERKSISTVPHCKFNSVSYAGLHHAISCGYGSNWLDQEWRDAATQNIIIPMQGEIDSMNVSVAAAILILKLKETRILNYRFWDTELKEKKKQNYENKLFTLITVITTTLSFGQITEPQVDAFSEQNLNHLMSLELQ